jgi:hypothetical protein
MSQATKAPPRKVGTRSGRTPAVQETASKTEMRANGLMGLGQIAQAACVTFGNYADAAAIGHFFPPLATEVVKVAENVEWLAGPIDFLIEVGPYTALFAAALPFGLQIAANHGWLDGSKLYSQGVMPPEILEAQMKAQIAKVQADAMRAQQQALQEAREAQEAFEAMMTREAA